MILKMIVTWLSSDWPVQCLDLSDCDKITKMLDCKFAVLNIKRSFKSWLYKPMSLGKGSEHVVFPLPTECFLLWREIVFEDTFPLPSHSHCFDRDTKTLSIGWAVPLTSSKGTTGESLAERGWSKQSHVRAPAIPLLSLQTVLNLFLARWVQEFS